MTTTRRVAMTRGATLAAAAIVAPAGALAIVQAEPTAIATLYARAAALQELIDANDAVQCALHDAKPADLRARLEAHDFPCNWSEADQARNAAYWAGTNIKALETRGEALWREQDQCRERILEMVPTSGADVVLQLDTLREQVSIDVVDHEEIEGSLAHITKALEALLA